MLRLFKNPAIANPLSKQLLLRIMSIYLCVFVLTTTLFMWLEFKQKREFITQQINVIENALEPSIKQSLWDQDATYMKSLLEGMTQIGIITGARLSDEQGEVLIELGHLPVNPVWLDNSSTYTLKRTQFFKSPVALGELKLISSRMVIWDQMKWGWFILLFNESIKAFSIIFLVSWVARHTLTLPLRRLTSSVTNLDFDDLKENFIDLKLYQADEIGLLAKTFNTMIQKLSQARGHLIELAQSLESTVIQRTSQLSLSNQRLNLINQITKEVTNTFEIHVATKIFIEQATKALRPNGSGSILFFEKERNLFRLYASFGLNLEYNGKFNLTIAPDQLYAQEVFLSQKAHLYSQDELKAYSNATVEELHFQKPLFQQLVIPVIDNAVSIGLVTVTTYDENENFNENDINFMESLTMTLSQHFRNMVLLEDAKRKDLEIYRMYEVLRMANQSLDLEMIILEMMKKFQVWYDVDMCCILLINFQEQIMFVEQHYGTRLGEGQIEQLKNIKINLNNEESIFSQVYHKNKLYYQSDLQSEKLKRSLLPADQEFFNLFPTTLTTILLIPIETQGIVIGNALLGIHRSKRISEGKQEKLQRHISQLSSLIRSAQLHQRLYEEKEELSIAYAELHKTKLKLAETVEIAKLKTAFERFVPRQFLERMEVDGLDAIRPGYFKGEKLTMLFSDIRSFTELCESQSVQENFRFINAYLTAMEPCVRNHGGFVDKFIGDAIMALYAGEQAAYNSIQSAIAMQLELNVFNQKQIQDGHPEIKIGVGINSGLVTIGVIGSENRMDSTVIGDHVNLASRIESLTKLYSAKIIISGFTHALVDHAAFKMREIDTVKVKGKEIPITIYEVFDADAPEVVAMKQASRDLLSQGIIKFKLKEFAEATRFFEECLKIYPKDVVPIEYLKRCYYLNKYPPTQKWWDGVMQDTDYSLHRLFKRRSARLESLIPINIYLRLRPQHYAAHMLDISIAGIKIESQIPLTLNDTIVVEIFFRRDTLDGFMHQVPLRILAQIAWFKSSPHQDHDDYLIYGLEYVMLTEKDEEILKQEMIEISLNEKISA